MGIVWVRGPMSLGVPENPTDSGMGHGKVVAFFVLLKLKKCERNPRKMFHQKFGSPNHSTTPISQEPPSLENSENG